MEEYLRLSRIYIDWLRSDNEEGLCDYGIDYHYCHKELAADSDIIGIVDTDVYRLEDWRRRVYYYDCIRRQGYSHGLAIRMVHKAISQGQ